MTKIIDKPLIEEIKENQKKLNGCDLHEFVLYSYYGDSKMIREYKCKRCDGTLRWDKVLWYNKGLVHGRSG